MKMQQAVSEVRKRYRFDIVLAYHPPELTGPDTAAIQREIILREVVDRDPRVDLSDEVLALLNKQYDAAGGRNSINLLIGPQE